MADEMSSTALVDLADIPAPVTQALARLAIFDAEHLVGVAEAPGVATHLAEAIDVSPEAMAGFLAAAREALPAPLFAAEFKAFAPPPMPLGALPPTPEMEAEMNKAAPPIMAPVALPPSVNLINLAGPIRNQGQRGTCVAFALTAVHELRRRQHGVVEDLSEQFLYDETKRIDGSPGTCGTWQVKAVGVLASLGECLESVWDYDPYPPCTGNGVQPAAARGDAAARRCAALILAKNDVQGAKAQLASGIGVGLSIPVYNSWYDPGSATRRSGHITLRVNGEPSVGGHAVCLVGYQDNDVYPGGGYFILRNSWDVAWGSACPYGAGHGTIPYAYVANDAWELVSVT